MIYLEYLPNLSPTTSSNLHSSNFSFKNTSNFFERIDELSEGDEIVLETTYGTFKYIVEKSAIVKETDMEAFKVTHDKETLIMYTCYPINRSVVGRKTKRYVVYAYKEGDTSE